MEENRGPGRRTKVYIDGAPQPLIASRSENAIPRDITGTPRDEMQTQQAYQLLADIFNSVTQINPMLRARSSAIRGTGIQIVSRSVFATL